MKTLIFESYGNNEIRLGFDDLPARAVKDSDSGSVRELERSGRIADRNHELWLRDNKLIEVTDRNGQKYIGNSNVGYSEVSVDPSKLDIIRELQQTPERPDRSPRYGYGTPVRPTTFTRSARHRILEGGALFDRELSKTHSGYFVTCTLPGSTPEAYDALSRWSGYVANLVLQCIRRYYRDAYWFYVWELQKRGALHLHLFCSLPKGEPSAHLNGRLRTAWYGALASVGDKTGVDMFRHQSGDYCTASQYWQYDFQEVETTPAQYISKYIGKGALAPMHGSQLGEDKFRYFPHRWWGMSRNLKKLTDEHRFRVCMDAMTTDDCNHILECMDAMLTDLEPVGKQEYTAEIGSDRETGQSVGVSHRRIFWFPAETFPEVDVMFRQLAIAWMQTKANHLRRWKYNSLDYKGIPVWQL